MIGSDPAGVLPCCWLLLLYNVERASDQTNVKRSVCVCARVWWGGGLKERERGSGVRGERQRERERAVCRCVFRAD